MIGLALGVPRMGKTQALLDYVGAHASTNRFFVVDRAGDWSIEAGRWRAVKFQEWKQRYGLFIRGGVDVRERGDSWYGEAPAPGGDVESWLDSLPPAGVFRFGWPWEGEAVAELTKAKGSTTYVDDELDFVVGQDVGSWRKNPLRDFCHRGRHLPNAQGVVGEVHLLGAARRPQSLNIDLTTLADWVMVFRVKGSRTWARLVDDHILSPEEISVIENLPPYHFKLWQASGDSSWGVLAPL